MIGPDPLEGFALDLDHEAVAPDTVRVVVASDRVPEADLDARFLVYLGIFDLLTEALFEACDTDEERTTRLRALLSRVQSVEPVLRFRLAERRRQSEGEELVSRMRGRDIAATRRWLIPRLEELIAACRARIDALHRALQKAGG